MRHVTVDDPHVSSHEITEICYLSHGTIHRIVHEELGMKNVCAVLCAILNSSANTPDYFMKSNVGPTERETGVYPVNKNVNSVNSSTLASDWPRQG